MNIAAASAALRDTRQVERTRTAITHERARWLAILRELELAHTQTRANFVFFDMGRPQRDKYFYVALPLAIPVREV
jgi:histidinol-phosphate aminotransferase